MNEQNTKLIAELVQDLNGPSSSKGWSKTFWKSWLVQLALSSCMMIIFSQIFPDKIHLPIILNSPKFWIEVLALLLLTISSAYLAYISSFPGRKTLIVQKLVQYSFLLVFITLLFHSTLTSVYLDFFSEISFAHGPCGMYILVVSGIWSWYLARLMNKAAPSNTTLTSISIAISSAAATSMLMHLFCRYETTAHIVIWHFLPLVTIVYLFSKIGKKIIKW